MLSEASFGHREAVVNAMVYVHTTLHTVNRRAARRGQRVMAITPRHFLDFIQHFVKLYNEKRSALEEEQLHLNVGLNKIDETVDQVIINLFYLIVLFLRRRRAGRWVNGTWPEEEGDGVYFWKFLRGEHGIIGN